MWRIVIVLIILPLSVFPQETSEQYIDKGLLRAQGNIAMGSFLKSPSSSTYYISGDLEYYTSRSISVKGSSNFFLGGSQNDYLIFTKNHSILVGALYHFKTKGNFDPFIGLEPGFNLSQLEVNKDIRTLDAIVTASTFPATVNPIFVTSAGFNYYANKYFSLFANVRLVQGKHFSDITAVSLNEVKFSFGLGWHLWVRKGYCNFAKPVAL